MGANVSYKVQKSDAEWREQLTDIQFKVTRKAGTERAFTGESWDNKETGTYLCICCRKPLFTSSAKYNSGTGWPSFYETAQKDSVAEKEDRKLFSRRTEVVCADCGAHLGHVFPDGPDPTGLRYCMNSASLDFVAESD